MKKQKRISDEKFKQILFSELNKGTQAAGLKTNFFELLRTKHSIHKTRALKLHDIYYPEWAELNQNVLVDTTISQSIVAAQKGLKSKLERTLFLQNEIDLMQKQLYGEEKFTWNNFGKVMQSHNGDTFVLPIQIQNELRRQIKDYQCEISKLEGDYAAVKHDITTKGRKIVNQIMVEVIDSRSQIDFYEDSNNDNI